MKKEYTFEELGYFAERECKAIKDSLQGYSYMNFDISWSNWAGNCVGRRIEGDANRELFFRCLSH